MKNPRAFPRPVAEIEDRWNEEQEGMTLLDYFAGQALNGFLSGSYTRVCDACETVAWAYEHAEAMLEERQKYLDKE